MGSAPNVDVGAISSVGSGVWRHWECLSRLNSFWVVQVACSARTVLVCRQGTEGKRVARQAPARSEVRVRRGGRANPLTRVRTSGIRLGLKAGCLTRGRVSVYRPVVQPLGTLPAELGREVRPLASKGQAGACPVPLKESWSRTQSLMRDQDLPLGGMLVILSGNWSIPPNWRQNPRSG